MHSPSARALLHLDRYYIILVRTLKHLIPAKCAINITYRYIYYQEHMSRRRRQGASNYVERHLHLRAFSAFRIRTVLDYGEYPLR